MNRVLSATLVAVATGTGIAASAEMLHGREKHFPLAETTDRFLYLRSGRTADRLASRLAHERRQGARVALLVDREGAGWLSPAVWVRAFPRSMGGSARDGRPVVNTRRGRAVVRPRPGARRRRSTGW